MTITMTGAKLAATLRALADGLASVDASDPEAPGVLTRIADRLSELAAQEHEPEIVTTMRTVAAQCAQVAEAMMALVSTGDANRSVGCNRRHPPYRADTLCTRFGDRVGTVRAEPQHVRLRVQPRGGKPAP